MSNFIAAMMAALSKDQSTLSNQELADAALTKTDVDLEMTIYTYWNGDGKSEGQLGRDAAQTEADESDSTKVTVDQVKYNKDAAIANGEESQMDGTTQTSQGQTSTDGTNLQTLAQQGQTLMTILSTTASLLRMS